MIYSDRQYAVSRAELAKLQTSLEAVRTNDRGTEPWVREIEIDALRSQIADVQAEISEYELLKSRQIALSETSSLTELPKVLVQARIIKGMSQTDLAERLNMKPQQVQRYEATSYMSASLARLIEVANILNVKISESIEVENKTTSGAIFSWADANDVVWSRVPLKEIVSRKWFTVPPKTNPAEAARDYFITHAGAQFATALHRKKVRGSNIPNEYALLAWQARILALARRFVEDEKIGIFELNDTWLSELVGLTQYHDGPARAQKLLAQHGIALVIERHLSGTHLDGAAMLSESGYPIIGITLRYDRLDNFWFVLFHELGHIFMHLFDNLKFDFFDEEDGAESDAIEQQADKFALDTLLPPELWDRCLSRFALSSEAVKIDAKMLRIDPSIIAGRIRKERNNYMILNDLVGQDTVRRQFEGAGG